MKNFSQTLKSLVLALILVGGLSYVFAWTGPSTTPPNGNVAAPVNTGSVGQVKTGYLGVSDLIAITSTASTYCIGTSCINSWSSVGGGVPSGAVMAFNLFSCPSGWEVSDGTNGTVNLRGYFVRGLNTGSSGLDLGRTLGSIQADDIKSHTHTVDMDQIENYNYIGSNRNTDRGGGSNASRSGALTVGYTGGTETRPQNVALLYCQKI